MIKLLIVEDEELLRMGLTTCVDWTELGYELVGEAGNGKKALELIEKNKPDAIITDIKMPHMSGIDMAEQINIDYPEIKIIVISGHDDFEYARRAIKAGVSEYILKPIKLEQLKGVMAEIRSQIETEQKEKQEYTDLKKKKSDDLQVLRQQLYAKLLLNKCDMTEVSIYIDRLDTYVLNKSYAAGLLMIQSFPIISLECDYIQIIKMDKDLEKLVNKRIEKYIPIEEREQVTILRANNGERLFCICCKSDAEVRSMIRKLQNIFGRLDEETEHLQLIFGHVYKGIEGLYNSYINACKSNEIEFMRSIKQTSEPRCDNNQINFMEYNEKELLFEIRSGSVEGIENELKNLQNYLSNENISSYIQLVLMLSKLYNEIIKLPEEVRGDIKDILENPKQSYHNVIDKKKRNDMVEELGKICQLVHSYFEKNQGSKFHGMMKKIHTYIEEHFAEEELNMKDVADYMFISISYLGIIIKKETGKTFIEYLTSYRIEKAKNYLVRGNMKNYETAIACGFSTASYFSTVFKGICGVTPSEFKHEQKK